MAKHSVLSKELLIISQLNQSCDQCFNQDCGLTHPVQLLGAFYMTQCVNVTVLLRANLFFFSRWMPTLRC